MSDPIDWHGWKFGKGNFTVYIGKVPRRKKFALSIESAGVLEPLAYFQSEDSARKMQAVMDGLADRMNALEKSHDR